MSSGKYDLGGALNLFFTESKEMLENMEQCLLALEKNPEDEESINSLFRSAHTIKGSSGMFGIDIIEKFTHRVENVLDNVRNNVIKISPELIQVLLNSHDHIDIMLQTYEGGQTTLTDDLQKKDDELRASLDSFIDSENIEQKESSAESISNQNFEEESLLDLPVANIYWHISIRFSKDVFRNGLDPQSFISYLNQMGSIKNIITIMDDHIDLNTYDAESCFLGYEIDLDSDATKEDIMNVFDFVQDDSDIRIIPPQSSIQDYITLIKELPEESMKIGEILKSIGSLTEFELEQALDLQKIEFESEDESKKHLGEIMLNSQMVEKPVLEAALEKQSDMKKQEEKIRKSIRIDADKLDGLINLVGELVITGSNVRQHSERSGDGELLEAVSTMSRLIEDIRDSTMNVRMVQIGETFNRYERIVRDLSKERNKKIELIINGGDTELDKTLIEKINDPLMHIIRNSADHGVETPEERIAAGKSEQGTIFLNAYHETGSIVIEIVDDGKGIDRQKLYNKAVEKGLISSDKKMSDDDILNLIFEPGLSTADKITNISGRGVGMDVVRRNIEALRGLIDIDTIEGEGTHIKIHLPLTLAIIDGFMVEVENAKYVLPLDMVTECIEITSGDLKGKDGGNFLNLRGDVLPFMKLKEFFKIDSEDHERENVVVLEYARWKAGLVVDRLVGEFQTVIKPMGKIFSNLKWVSGSTILGTGEVALILDVPMLIQHIKKLEEEKLSTV